MSYVQCLVISLFAFEVSSFLNLEELKTIDYGIDILDKPIVVTEDAPPGAIFVSSKYGQQYQCAYPDKSGDDRKEKEDEKIALEKGIPDLLRPMEESPCLIHTNGWWTYEFCYGKHLKQYHMEDGKISGNTIYIGHYESEFDWNNETEAAKSKKSRLNKYHSQKYVNGSTCDLTNTARKAEVRFMCEDGAGDYITRVDEPETCSYIFTVRTTKICHHPYLKPPTKNRPVPITCNPLLSEEEYALYVEELEEEKLIEAEAAEESTGSSKEIGGIDMERLLSDTLVKNLKDKFGTEEIELKDVGVKVIKNSDDIKSMLRDAMKADATKQKKPLTVDQQIEDYELRIKSGKQDIAEAEIAMNTFPDDEVLQAKYTKTMEKAEESLINYKERLAELQRLKQKQENLRSLDDNGQSGIVDKAASSDMASDINDGQPSASKDGGEANHQVEEEDEVDDEDKDLLNEFDEGYNEIADSAAKKEKISKFKDNIGSAMQAQFGDILDEAQNEMNKEGMDIDVDNDEAMEQLTKTLGKLLKRLEKTEKDIKNIDEQLAKAEDIVNDGEEENENFEDVLEVADDTGAEDATTQFQSSSKTSTTIKSPFTQSKDRTLKYSKLPTKTKLNAVKLSDRVRVRVKQFKKGDPIPHEDEKTSLKLSSQQKEKLEKTVKSQLKKTGMDTEGRKIEVRIITAGYYDSDEGSMHTLSEEETQSFNKMIVAVLGQNDDELKEIQRHDRLESNYEFNYDKNKKSKSKSAGGYS